MAHFYTSFSMLLSSLLLLCSPATAQQTQYNTPTSKVRIAVIGDSTVSNYASTNNLRGWGQVLIDFLDEQQVEVINKAKGGRSSKSFIDEGRWDNVLELEPKPNYVIIQFGHNDNPFKAPDRRTLTTPVPETLPSDQEVGSKLKDYYQYNLKHYVEESRQMGAVPIIVAPMERGVFKDGKLWTPNAPYAQAALQVAKELDVPSVDLNSYGLKLYESIGPDEAMQYHGKTEKGYDRSHYNEKGARLWAKYIVEQISKQIPSFNKLTKNASQSTNTQTPINDPQITRSNILWSGKELNADIKLKCSFNNQTSDNADIAQGLSNAGGFGITSISGGLDGDAIQVAERGGYLHFTAKQNINFQSSTVAFAFRHTGKRRELPRTLFEVRGDYRIGMHIQENSVRLYTAKAVAPHAEWDAIELNCDGKQLLDGQWHRIAISWDQKSNWGFIQVDDQQTQGKLPLPLAKRGPMTLFLGSSALAKWDPAGS
ncbi:MAG TPA: hypothetical protein DER01_11970, partial [Phycisphaerales bacterium]|nr:hypothetical protein [Phycisphaerales bacterium]